MTPIAFARVPRLGAPFGGGFDFAAAPSPTLQPGALQIQSPDFTSFQSSAQAPAGDAPGIEVLPPAMRPFYAYQVTTEEPAPGTPPVKTEEDGLSTTTALIIGAATLVGVAAIVAFASKG